ncbi:NAD-dependent succinate-semialdehyde dehydrogenase [Arthrobacter sp. zg-Y40]|uniref:NAD-dependent succinate-semialdehyde dehydrogenase n=1 Tax=unclassified Arthrobacter TaxID=235627 RepID=UPI001D13F25A|nr:MULTISPECIES: NAD-dependent succinate-semialdehyde dehydrogenase [unclassified Arthrobacter]MCC3275253.1 NAD-dependent succinate-semialdehyde dehydrogenase [Arthrobacter sp. zg-Y20]MCC3278329.1 NAD-dependent succinate-semialdehyde dehydrogenase [Arthrobacter sp. zg-Y40]MDK1315410.1 NAD-dependent succinate-semialdehyde dehydrogenase [Arthrobacter sp. zg.Y20]MDK1326597.1 NAD-dependent succinate-semialdehyde dehydrogenase [Arthrobacter sp. zg-Y1143]WIB05827.1 NAD-dependent succinate-semialdehy
MTAYKSVNPATGETLQEFPEATDAQISQAVTSAHEAYLAWRNEPVASRAKVVARVAELYRERADELAALIATEMGKPLTQAKGEVALSANIYEYYATEGPGFMADEQLAPKGGGTAVVRTLPVGPLLGIMPWNFPYYQVARFAGPNLVLGNTVLLKHANNCPQSALAMAQIFADAGVPEGAYINLFATNEQAADIIADPRIQGVSLTGSERAGAAVAEVAGRNLKKYVLELGGSDPFIVLDSPDLDATVKAAVAGRMNNAGQACNAAKRFIVMEDIYEEFVEKFTAGMAAMEPGDPLDPETRFGPLSSQAAADGLVEQIRNAVEQGATLRTGGGHIDGPGAYVQPTVLTDVTPDMRAFSEELFGPAAVIYKVASADEAVELANNSPFGLGGTVFSADEDKALEVADQLESGMVWINGTASTQPDLPFGGVKRSGVGRELGRYGMDEFVNKKLVRTPAKR